MPFQQLPRLEPSDPELTRLLEWIRPFSLKYRFYTLFLALKFVYKLVLTKYLLLFSRSDLVIYEVDTLLHPAVYITYHLPFMRRIDRNWIFRIVRLAFGSPKNVSIFYLDTPPDVAMTRILERKREISPHENLQDLARLKCEFDRVIEIASRSGFDVKVAKTASLDAHEVVDQIELILEQTLTASV